MALVETKGGGMYTSISFYYYVLYLVCNIREKFARYAISERERESCGSRYAALLLRPRRIALASNVIML